MVKRFFDIIFSFLCLIIFFPLILLIIFLIKMKLGSPIFFTQVRPGLNEKLFILYKFRTMRAQDNESDACLNDSERMTNFGKFLRSTSLDELPELMNILMGDMSFVGPRPLLVEYLPLYNKFQSRRHAVRPGLTGWAQIHGRNAITWDKKFSYDVWYIEHQSFWLDIKILFLTLIKVLKRENISQDNRETVDKFKGNQI